MRTLILVHDREGLTASDVPSLRPQLSVLRCMSNSRSVEGHSQSAHSGVGNKAPGLRCSAVEPCDPYLLPCSPPNPQCIQNRTTWEAALRHMGSFYF